MSLTQDEANAFEALRVGFWQQVTGQTGNDLLRGLQDLLSAAGMLSDQLANIQALLSGVSPSSLPQPYSETVPIAGATGLVAQNLVKFTVRDIDANSPFDLFTAPYDGSFVLFVSTSGGGVITVNMADLSGQASSTQLFSGNDIGSNVASAMEQPMVEGIAYTFQCSIGGTATFYAIGWPGL